MGERWEGKVGDNVEGIPRQTLNGLKMHLLCLLTGETLLRVKTAGFRRKGSSPLGGGPGEYRCVTSPTDCF